MFKVKHSAKFNCQAKQKKQARRRQHGDELVRAAAAGLPANYNSGRPGLSVGVFECEHHTRRLSDVSLTGVWRDLEDESRRHET